MVFSCCIGGKPANTIGAADVSTRCCSDGTLYPYLRFSLSGAYLNSGLPQLLPVEWLAPARLLLDVSFAIIMLSTIALILSGRIEKPQLGPKHLLLAVVIGFTFAVFSLLDDLLTITATLTIFHNLQYHRIVWQYEREQGLFPSGRLAAYLTLGLALGLFGICRQCSASRSCRRAWLATFCWAELGSRVSSLPCRCSHLASSP